LSFWADAAGAKATSMPKAKIIQRVDFIVWSLP
jgi:hypothetical protein